jgi:hypothetical protein
MAAKNVTGKLGNMRKAVEWVLYPQNADEPHIVIIQCDKRIAKVNTLSAIAILSSGKGGHNGFAHLSPVMGAVSVSVPTEMNDELKRLTSTNTEGNGIGAVVLIGGK